MGIALTSFIISLIFYFKSKVLTYIYSSLFAFGSIFILIGADDLLFISLGSIIILISSLFIILIESNLNEDEKNYLNGSILFISLSSIIIIFSLFGAKLIIYFTLFAMFILFIISIFRSKVKYLNISFLLFITYLLIPYSTVFTIIFSLSSLSITMLLILQRLDILTNALDKYSDEKYHQYGEQKLQQYENSLMTFHNSNKELTSDIKTKEVMLREINHRVKNNIQMILSIYRLKLKSTLDIEQKNKLAQAEDIIIAMANIHELLYKQDDIDNIDFNTYFTNLANEIKRGYKEYNITFDIKTDVKLGIDESINLGIITNELITNSFKYAFADQEKKKGTITLNITKKDQTIYFDYGDSGKGYDPSNISKNSFGLMLINGIVKNLKGKFSYENNHTVITFIPKKERF